MPKQGDPFTAILLRGLLALFGAHDLRNFHETGRMSLSPQKIHVHDDWNPNLESYDADIAILTFEAGAIVFSSYVQPICLWNEKTDPTQTEGHAGWWGRSQNLEKHFEKIPTKLQVPIHTQEFCFLTTKDLVNLASNRTFCGGKGGGRGICDGDSGGGVSIKVRSTFYLRGIFSSGLRDQMRCDVSKFGIFTDVLKFKSWIDQIMREDTEILIQGVQVYLRCTIESTLWNTIKTCDIYDQKIDDEGFSVAGDPNPSIEAFTILKNNQVEFLPENIFESFPQLISYEAWLCAIRTVNGKHFKGLNKLEHLDLAYNEIESIDADSFKDLTKLNELHLHDNKIEKIDPLWFQSLETLSVFFISHNQIEFLNETIFDNLQNIRKIRLDNNKLSTIPANLFKNNLKLEHIWLEVNKIQTISSTMFDHLPNTLIYVDLRDNPWCKCCLSS